MKVKELIRKLKTFDGDIEVFINRTESKFGLLSSVEKQKVVFTEDPDYVTEIHEEDDVVLLSEE